ncbi:hypothetical protein NKH56_33620 [Mesorhizobium sp. M1076]|uniref:SLOG cluster 4 domain-containing protein n=1 Tax=Mesorhizobium sp. M1076 TaxID=2957054 RepID=UPI00333A679F
MKKEMRAPIIAVFGSGQLIDQAISIGREVARANAILLTGGSGVEDGTVKGAAINGAEAEGGRWIGVLRHVCNDGFPGPSAKRKNFGLILEPRLGHRRNYLEACLCDVAIALKGGKGTISEVVACASLEKPVVLVGWDDAIIRNLDWLIADKYCPRIDALEERITQLNPAVFDSEVVVRVSAETSPDGIVKKALQLAGAGRTGAFPAFLGDVYLPLSDAFEAYTDGQ